MLKSLYPEVDWEGVMAVGLDVDGTLYDEFDFVRQAYHPIAERIAEASAGDAERIFAWMTHRWWVKGSSYPFIFGEALERQGLDPDDHPRVIAECVALYRSCSPTLDLPQRVRWVLDELAKRHPLFIVTDGNPQTQRAKTRALGLDAWISTERMFYTGDLGPQGAKPSVMVLDKVGTLARGSVVFFGDRDCDADFSRAAGFQFVRVDGMRTGLLSGATEVA